MYGGFFPGDLVTKYSINMELMTELQWMESSLHKLLVAMSIKPRTSSRVVNNMDF